MLLCLGCRWAGCLWREGLPSEEATDQKKTMSEQNESISTWKHRQPSSVIGDPNRITRQARILPTIFKSNIGQVENFYLLICGINTCGLGIGGGGKEKKK